jgi:hypothetical protein
MGKTNVSNEHKKLSTEHGSHKPPDASSRSVIITQDGQDLQEVSWDQASLAADRCVYPSALARLAIQQFSYLFNVFCPVLQEQHDFIAASPCLQAGFRGSLSLGYVSTQEPEEPEIPPCRRR